MRNRLRSLAVLLVVLLSSVAYDVKASHMAGAEITYSWISGSTYKLTYRLYRDCSGITEPASVSCCYYATCGGPAYTVTLNKAPGANGQEVGTGCPGYNSTCNGGTNPGYQEWIYEGNVTLPTQCNFWKFFVSINARNPAISNLNNPGGNNLYVETTFDNQAAQGNSSPFFTVKPINYMCVNSNYTYNNGAIDPNGDSLSYELIMPLGGQPACTPGAAGTPMMFSNASFNLTTNPISTNNSFTLNAGTGSMNFTPNSTQVGVITILVREWRNGVQIGSIMRDMQYVVLNCTSTPPNLATNTASLSGVQLVNGQVQGCAGQPFNFCFDVTSSSTAAILVVSANNAITAPGSTIAYTGTGGDTVQGCFSWVPTIADTGLKVLSVTVKDSNCAPPGIILTQTFTIPLYVWGPTVAWPDTAICMTDSIQMNVKGGLTYQWSVLPGGSPITSLSCTNCKNPMANPSTTTQYVVTSLSGNTLCNKYIDTVTVTVLPPPNFSLGPDVTTCVGDSMQLNVNLVPDPGMTYSVTWSPGNFLDDPNSETPIVKPLHDTTYIVTIIPNGIGQCGGRDTIFVNALQGYTVFNKDTAICKGAPVQITALGEAEYTYTWTPSTGVSNPGIINPLLTPDTTEMYTLTASYPGCTDSVHLIYIDVQPIPSVYVGADQILCLGDTVHIQTLITPPLYPNYSYNWTPGGGLNSATIAKPVFTALTTTTLTLTVKTPAGCLGNDNVKFTVVPTDFITITDDTAICPRDVASLRVTGGSIASLVWTPNIYMDDSTGFTTNAYPVTSTTYTVVARDTNYCLDTAYMTVEVKPEAVITLPDSVRIYPGQSYQIDPGGNALYFQWFPPLGLNYDNISNPIANPNVNTRYFVYAATEFGCTANDSIDVYVSYDSFIDVPNAFTPGSAPNATIKVVHLGDATLRSFTIYNRWGQKVFSTANIGEGWDGTLGGKPQPMGVYVYTVEAVSPTGRKFTKQGNITLIR